VSLRVFCTDLHNSNGGLDVRKRGGWGGKSAQKSTRQSLKMSARLKRGSLFSREGRDEVEKGIAGLSDEKRRTPLEIIESLRPRRRKRPRVTEITTSLRKKRGENSSRRESPAASNTVSGLPIVNKDDRVEQKPSHFILRARVDKEKREPTSGIKKSRSQTKTRNIKEQGFIGEGDRRARNVDSQGYQKMKGLYQIMGKRKSLREMGGRRIGMEGASRLT